jgi:hypothetical protein
MRSKNRRLWSDQLQLFPPTAPLRWSEVPAEARARTVGLLARLLRQHVQAHRGVRWRHE